MRVGGNYWKLRSDHAHRGAVYLADGLSAPRTVLNGINLAGDSVTILIFTEVSTGAYLIDMPPDGRSVLTNQHKRSYRRAAVREKELILAAELYATNTNSSLADRYSDGMMVRISDVQT